LWPASPPPRYISLPATRVALHRSLVFCWVSRFGSYQWYLFGLSFEIRLQWSAAICCRRKFSGLNTRASGPPNGTYIPNGEGLFLKGMGRCAYAKFDFLYSKRGHAIHGSHDKHLGKPVSHGCVRLSPGNAARLFSLVRAKVLPTPKSSSLAVSIKAERPSSTRSARRSRGLTGPISPARAAFRMRPFPCLLPRMR
jgi:hypothetical protein